MRIIRRAEVIKRTGLSKSTIDNLVSERKFPAKFELGTRAVGWLRHEVDAWIEERAGKRL
ncbi:hypothetical protein IP81_07485 [Novosphingobium sp. AAP83]|nr:hypothetical protein IP81_07485 [Novosphingobium sp. AAP83]